MIRSLRMRLFLGATAVMVVALGILSVAIDAAVHHTLLAEFDRVLLEKARALASMVEQSGDKTHFDFQPGQFPEFEAGPKAAYFEVFLDGVPYQHSASLGAGHLGVSIAAKPKAVECVLPDGRKGRQLALAFEPLIETDEPTGALPAVLPKGMMVVAQDSSDLDRTLDRLRGLSLGLCGAATLLAGAALVAVAGRAIRPVKVLAQEIEAVRETDLSATLSSGDFPTELEPVVDRLNGLLGRLGEAFTRERAFTADVAHELRTPLAAVLATLQVARSRPRETGAYESSIDKSLVVLGQMQALVENLLLLARAESGQLAVRRTAVDVAGLMHECRAVFEEAAARRGLTLALREEEIPPVMADREMVRIVLCNLLDNAVSYAQAGSAVEMRILRQGETAAVEIANRGHALVAEDLPNLLKRFVRKDMARSATGVHAGLGLSICQRLLDLQGGKLALRLEEEMFVARVELA